ncbi:MAG: hypothetical protein ACJ763_07380 [Bdellovibrionia bacterium]
MKNTLQAVVVGGANLLALGVMPSDPTLLQPVFSDPNSTSRTQVMSDAQMRNIEASHLEVYAGCKWGKAAFDPVQVASEIMPESVKSLYKDMIQA